MRVRIKKINPSAAIPTYAKDGDAGMDVIATSIISEEPFQITYGLGISLEIPNSERIATQSGTTRATL